MQDLVRVVDGVRYIKHLQTTDQLRNTRRRRRTRTVRGSRQQRGQRSELVFRKFLAVFVPGILVSLPERTGAFPHGRGYRDLRRRLAAHRNK